MDKTKESIYNIIVVFLLIWCMLQEFLLPLFLKITGSTQLTSVLFYMKDLLYVMLIAMAIYKTKLINKKVFLFYLIFFSILLIYSLIGFINGGSIASIVSSFRSLSLFPSFFLIGNGIDNKSNFVNKVLNKLMFFIVIMSIFGIVEYYFDIFYGTKSFWTETVGLTDFLTTIKGQGDRLIYGLPGNFYGSYGNGWFSTKRLVGLWASPLTAAYNIFIAVVYYLLSFLSKRKLSHLVFFMITSFALYLTSTRLIILFTIPMIFIIMLIQLKKYRALVFGTGFILFIFFIIFQHGNIGDYLIDSSTKGHQEGIINAIPNLKFLGEGLGIFGASAAINGNNIVGTESAYISCLGQIGVIGFTLYFGIWVFIVYKDFRFLNSNKSNLILLINTLGIVLFLTGFFSEQILAFTSSAFPFILIGILHSLQNESTFQNDMNMQYSSLFKTQNKLMEG